MPGTLVFVISGSYPGSMHNVHGSTQMPACVWNNAQGFPLPVKAWTVAIWPVQCCCNLKPKQNKNTKLYGSV